MRWFAAGVLTLVLVACGEEHPLAPERMTPLATTTESGLQLSNPDTVQRLYSFADSEVYTRLDPNFEPGAERLRVERGQSVVVPYRVIEGFQDGVTTAIVVWSWTGSVFSEGQWLPVGFQMEVVPIR